MRLKPRYFKSPWSDYYENWHVLPGNLVQTYSSVFLNLKVYLPRKYKNKSVGVRKAVRPKKKIVVFQVPCKKKTGSVGRLFFFFFFFFFFFC